MDPKKFQEMKNFVNSREPNTDNSIVNSLMEFAKELLMQNASLKAELDNQKYINVELQCVNRSMSRR